MDVIYADYATGEQLGVLDAYKIDFEIGDAEGSNTWQALVSTETAKRLPDKTRVYIPNTEYGGILWRRGVDYATGLPLIGGYTWRGLLQRKIDDFASMTSKDAHQALYQIINGTYQTPRYWTGSKNLISCINQTVGVNSNWGGARHVTILEAAEKALAGTGYKMVLSYGPLKYGSIAYGNARQVSVGAFPPRVWAEGLYDDVRLRYDMELRGDYVNHLLCLGEGELDNRLVRHIYADENGNISQTKVYTNADEIMEVFDYPGADADTLIYYGTRRMRERLQEAKHFRITIDADRTDIEIGDSVQVYDEATGITMTAPITGKTLTITGDIPKVEYTLSNDIIAEAS